MIDLGAIAKGYIADQIKSYLLKNKVNSALINLGGNILCVGQKNNNPFSLPKAKQTVLKASPCKELLDTIVTEDKSLS